MKKLSFIILNYKSPDHFRLCIENIQKLGLDYDYEIIAIDNASNDGSDERIPELFPDVTYIANSKNVGHPAGNNVGFRVATGEYVVMVNPDIIFRSKEDVDRIVQYLDAHTDVAILGPKLHNPDGSIQNTCFRKYSRLTPIYRRTFFGKLPFGKRDIHRHLMTDFNHDDTREVEWLLGACLFIRKSALDEIGFMNEKLFLYFGDYELCDRAREKNWKVVYYHDTSGIFHYHKRESASSRFSFLQAFSYVTRIHLKDWMEYLKQ